jgi:hypothetical protein
VREKVKLMTLKLRDGICTADTEYGIALLDEESGQYWNLNPTGALVLRILVAGGTVAQIVEELAEQYAVETDIASRDVEELVGDLRSAGLIEQEAPAGPAVPIKVQPRRRML